MPYPKTIQKTPIEQQKSKHARTVRAKTEGEREKMWREDLMVDTWGKGLFPVRVHPGVWELIKHIYKMWLKQRTGILCVSSLQKRILSCLLSWATWAVRPDVHNCKPLHANGLSSGYPGIESYTGKRQAGDNHSSLCPPPPLLQLLLTKI